MAEETNEWPVSVGTIYRLQDSGGDWMEVTVSAIEENKLVEFSKNDGYHCRYTFLAVNSRTAELTYHEWMDGGELQPLNPETLKKLKAVVEADG